MKKVWIAVLCALVLLPVNSFAKKRKMLNRGGFGFVYPDANRFLSNAGHIARGKYFAADVQYAQQDQSVTLLGTTLTSTTKEASASAVVGANGFGFGIRGLRSGSEVDDPNRSIDSIEAAMGFTAMKNKLSFGLSYERSIDSSPEGDGTVHGSIMIHSKKGAGATFGAGVSQTLGLESNETGVIAGLGYMFKGMNNYFEIDFEMPNINNTDNWVGSFLFGLGSEFVYMSAGYQYVKTVLVDSHVGLGRLGVILGGKVDISLFAAKSFEPDNDPKIGANLRLAL